MRSTETNERRICIAIHDVSPLTLTASRRLINLVMRIAPGAPLTLLVVPFHHGRQRIDMSSAMRELVDARLETGDELALHGFCHRDDGAPPRHVSDWFARRMLTDGEAEFAALDASRARHLVAAGLNLFHACGWQPAGFVPPAWQISCEARTMLHEFPLSYVASRDRIESLMDGQLLAAPALSFSARSGLRRIASRQWYKLWLANYSTAPLLRLALHPADAEFPSLLHAWSRIIERLLDDRRAITKGTCLKPDRRLPIDAFSHQFV